MMMSKTEARLTAVLALFLMLIVWLVEFGNILDFKVGTPSVAEGRIVACGGIGPKTGWFTVRHEKIHLLIDTLGNKKLVFTKPSSARQEVIALCGNKARVRVAYQTRKPPLRNDYQYSLLAITDLGSNNVIFTRADRNAAKRHARIGAYGILAFALLAFFFAAGVQSGLIQPRGAEEFERDMHHGGPRGMFVIRSSERRFSAFAFLVLSGDLGFLLAYVYLFRQREIWLVPLALFALAAAYAFLAEIINVNELSFEQGDLLFRKRPLPWFFNRKRIPVNRIEKLIPEVTRESSAHGPVTLFSVAVRHSDGSVATLFFVNSFSEATAIAGLANRHLSDHYGLAIPAEREPRSADDAFRA